MTINIPILDSQLHVRWNRRLRWVEDKRMVPVVTFGPLVISYWNRRVIERERITG